MSGSVHGVGILWENWIYDCWDLSWIEMLDLWFCEGGVEDKFGWDNGQQNGRETIGLSSNDWTNFF